MSGASRDLGTVHNWFVTITRALEASMRPDAISDFRLTVKQAHLGQPIELSEQAISRFVHPFQWMLEHVGHTGIPLTGAGYLPPAVVSRAMTELGWDEHWHGKANREVQSAPVLTIRQSMHTLKLLHRRKGMLLTTPLGRKLTGDPHGLWDLLARSITQTQTEVETRAWEFFLLSIACQSSHTRGGHEAAIAHGLWSIGWVERDGEPIPAKYVFELIREPWRTLHWLGAFTTRTSATGWSAPTETMIAFARYCLRLTDETDSQDPPAPDILADPGVRDIFSAFGVVHKPGMAADLMKELAPLLAAEGIDLAHGEALDLPELNAALSRAVERSNFERFNASGDHRTKAMLVLRATSEAFAENDHTLVDVVIDGVHPEPGVDGDPSIAHVIGLSLGLLDTWYTAAELGQALARTRIAKWHSPARTAATDIIALARKGRAFDSIQSLHGKYNGLVILHGSVLAVAAALQSWAEAEHITVRELGQMHLTEPNQ